MLIDAAKTSGSSDRNTGSGVVRRWVGEPRTRLPSEMFVPSRGRALIRLSRKTQHELPALLAVLFIPKRTSLRQSVSVASTPKLRRLLDRGGVA